MSGPVGHTFIYNIIIIFVIIVFAFLAGTLSYYKAFKVNNTIVSSIEKYEGYNSLSKTEMEQNLRSIGYSTGDTSKCPITYKNMNFVTISNSEQFKYCIYIDKEKPKKGEYYTYGVLTYMNLDLPIVSVINIPIFTKTNRIYKFTNN